jgi:hypothetical protein
MRCQPRFNYAKSKHQTEISDRCAMFVPVDNHCHPLASYSTTALEPDSQDVISEFALQSGATAMFVLGGTAAPRTKAQAGGRAAAIPANGQVFGKMDFEVDVQGSLARNG